MKRRLALCLVHLVLTLVALVMLTPMVWLVAASFKAPDDLFHYLFFSPRLSIYNFRRLFEEIPFVRFLMNSFFYAGATVMLQLLFSSMGGFALARYEFRFKRTVTFLMAATMMIPAQVLMAPLYELLYHMRLVDTRLGLIAPGAVSVFGIFLFRQAMSQLPEELLQAARIDGAGEFRIYWNVAAPLTRPTIGAFCLVAFIGAWNNFLWPQIVLHSQNLFTLPIGLNQMVGIYEREYGALMAGTLLSVIPVMILFVILQREFISGLTEGAVK